MKILLISVIELDYIFFIFFIAMVFDGSSQIIHCLRIAIIDLSGKQSNLK